MTALLVHHLSQTEVTLSVLRIIMCQSKRLVCYGNSIAHGDCYIDDSEPC